MVADDVGYAPHQNGMSSSYTSSCCWAVAICARAAVSCWRAAAICRSPSAICRALDCEVGELLVRAD